MDHLRVNCSKLSHASERRPTIVRGDTDRLDPAVNLSADILSTRSRRRSRSRTPKRKRSHSPGHGKRVSKSRSKSLSPPMLKKETSPGSDEEGRKKSSKYALLIVSVKLYNIYIYNSFTNLLLSAHM